MLHRKCLISTVNVLLHLAIALSCTPTAAALLKSIHISVESVSTQDLPVDGPGSSLGEPRISGYQACRNPGCDGWVLELLIEKGKTDTGKDGTAASTLALDEAESATPAIAAAAALGSEGQNAALKSALLCFELCMAPAQGPLDRLPLMSIYTESNSDNGPKIGSI